MALNKNVLVSIDSDYISGEIIYGAGLEDIVNDKPAMIKLSEGLIYYINDNCLPLDGYVEQAVDRYMQFLSKDEEGQWVVQSDEYAFENWLESAKLGYAPAQFSVGASYIIGSGVEKDLSEAKRWLQLAIDSTYEHYSRVAQTLYTLNELHKY